MEGYNSVQQVNRHVQMEVAERKIGAISMSDVGSFLKDVDKQIEYTQYESQGQILGRGG